MVLWIIFGCLNNFLYKFVVLLMREIFSLKVCLIIVMWFLFNFRFCGVVIWRVFFVDLDRDCLKLKVEVLLNFLENGVLLEIKFLLFIDLYFWYICMEIDGVLFVDIIVFFL